MQTLSRTDSIPFCFGLCVCEVELKDRDRDRVFTQQWVDNLYLHIIIIPTDVTHATTSITLSTVPAMAPAAEPAGKKVCVSFAIQVTLLNLEHEENL